MEKKLKKLFDYQRFEKNERLEKIIKETEEEVDILNKKLAELTEDELKQVSGGIHILDKKLESPDISGTSDSAPYPDYQYDI